MSEFFIQEKQLSRATRTIVKDEKGKSLFLMVGRWGTKGDALSLYAMNGDLVAHIKQISLTFGTRFELYKDFEKVGTMQKIFNWPGDFYYIRRLHWTVQGDIYNHRYQIQHFNEPIMEMDKQPSLPVIIMSLISLVKKMRLSVSVSLLSLITGSIEKTKTKKHLFLIALMSTKNKVVTEVSNSEK